MAPSPWPSRRLSQILFIANESLNTNRNENDTQTVTQYQMVNFRSFSFKSDWSKNRKSSTLKSGTCRNQSFRDYLHMFSRRKIRTFCREIHRKFILPSLQVNRYLVVSASDHCSSYRTKNPKSVMNITSMTANKINNCFEFVFFVIVPDIKTFLSLKLLGFEIIWPGVVYIQVSIDGNLLIASTNERFYAYFMVSQMKIRVIKCVPGVSQGTL